MRRNTRSIALKGKGMELGLIRKNALVFGAGGGLGGAIATSLAEEGAIVHLADKDFDSAERNAETIRQAGGSAEAIAWDISDLASIEHRISTIEAEFGPVSILVNNTGGPPPTTAHAQEPHVWSEYFQMMVLSVITITDRVLPGMRNAGWGRIITSTSSGVVAPIANLGISNALRLSLVGWSKTLAREVGADGITSNIVLPGRIATPRIRFLDEQKSAREKRDIAEVVRESTAAIPVGRYGDPKEYGDAVAFLASARASYITGSILRIDGGLIPSI